MSILIAHSDAVGVYLHWALLLFAVALAVDLVLAILRIRGFDVPDWFGAIVWSVVLVDSAILAIRLMLLEA